MGENPSQALCLINTNLSQTELIFLSSRLLCQVSQPMTIANPLLHLHQIPRKFLEGLSHKHPEPTIKSSVV